MYRRMPHRQWVIYRATFQVHTVGKRLKPMLSRRARRQDDEREDDVSVIIIIMARNYQALTIYQEVVFLQQPSEVETITTIPIS